MMMQAAILGIDSCAIEGYNESELNEILGIDPAKKRVAMLLPFGYRIKEQKPQIAKVCMISCATARISKDKFRIPRLNSRIPRGFRAPRVWGVALIKSSGACPAKASKNLEFLS